MIMKKKTYNEGMKKSRSNDIPDNKDNTKQNERSQKDNSGVDTEKKQSDDDTS